MDTVTIHKVFQSTALHSGTYTPSTRTLTLTFPNGRTLSYPEFPQSWWKILTTSDSPGTVYNTLIKRYFKGMSPEDEQTVNRVTARLLGTGYSPACTKLVKQFEGLRLTAYADPAGIVTIGYGHVGIRYNLGDTITESTANNLLSADLARACQCVLSLKISLTQMEIDALTSFVFNIGCGAFNQSSIRKLLSSGDFAAAALEFPKWVHSNGFVLPGLVRRRAAEQALFQSQP